MSLSCAIDSDSGDYECFFRDIEDEAPLSTKRARKCCSCGAQILVGQASRRVPRGRPPYERCNWIEERIYGDEVPLAPYYLCETCGDLADSLSELGFCFTLGGQSLKAQIAEYREEGGRL